MSRIRQRSPQIRRSQTPRSKTWGSLKIYRLQTPRFPPSQTFISSKNEYLASHFKNEPVHLRCWNTRTRVEQSDRIVGTPGLV